MRADGVRESEKPAGRTGFREECGIPLWRRSDRKHRAADEYRGRHEEHNKPPTTWRKTPMNENREQAPEWPKKPQTCRYCRWYKVSWGENDLPPMYRRDLVGTARNVKICCYNPPNAGTFPWSFGETRPDMTCSKFEPIPLSGGVPPAPPYPG